MRYLGRYINKLLFLGIFVFSVPVALFLVSQRTSFFGRAAGERANLVIDTSTSFERPSYVWRNFSQGGEESNGQMIKPIIAQTKALKPEYIRIDHIFDFYDVVSRGSSGGLNYNWAKLDLVLDDILQTGAKPFISLNPMPMAITSGGDTDTPRNWNEWKEVVQKTIEHISRDRKVSEVYYEVWNEPDLFGNWKTYGKKNYLDLYLYASRGAITARSSSGVLPFKIGGPATTALYEGWFTKFIEYVQKNNLPLDFYSWHKYSLKLEDFEDDTLRARVWLDQLAVEFPNLELIISEMGHDSNNNVGYDTNFGAIHTLASLASLDNALGRGFSFELKDGPGPQKLWGRWGLLTHEKYGVPEVKPRYRSFEFLNLMEGKRVNVIGQGSWVKSIATNNSNRLRVLMVNYDPDNKHTEAVPIEFINIENGDYTIKKTDFLGGTTERKVTATNGSLKTIEYLSANSAIILELILR